MNHTVSPGLSTQMSYAVPRPIFEAIESSLFAASRAFIRSLAEDVLEVPPADLLRRVLPSKDAFKLVLYDAEDIKECYAFAPHPSQPDIAIRCRRAALPGECYCSIHRHERPSLQLRIEPAITWRPLKVGPELPTLWVNEAGIVFDASKTERGSYNETTGELTLFEFTTTT